MSPFRQGPVRILSRTRVVRRNYIFMTLLWLSLCRVCLCWSGWFGLGSLVMGDQRISFEFNHGRLWWIEGRSEQR
jgi:hypothetical protein